jgi:hypothetical protein
MELSFVLQPWMAVPAFTTLAVLCFRAWVIHDSGGRSDGDGWFFFIVWAAMTVPALLAGWIK